MYQVQVRNWWWIMQALFIVDFNDLLKLFSQVCFSPNEYKTIVIRNNKEIMLKQKSC